MLKSAYCPYNAVKQVPETKGDSRVWHDVIHTTRSTTAAEALTIHQTTAIQEIMTVVKKNSLGKAQIGVPGGEWRWVECNWLPWVSDSDEDALESHLP